MKNIISKFVARGGDRADKRSEQSADTENPGPNKISKKQVIIMGIVGVVLLPVLFLLLPPVEDPAEPAKPKQQVVQEAPPTEVETVVETEAPAVVEQSQSGKMVVGAPKDAGWVLRLMDFRSARAILRQRPLQMLLDEPRFPFSTAALNSAYFASKFDPVYALEGLDDLFEGTLTVVGVRRLNRWQGYAYARVRQSAWKLWKQQMLQDPARGWSQAGDQMLIRPMSLTLPTGEITDPMLVYSNGTVVCISIGEQAMDEFISIWNDSSMALELNKVELDSQSVHYYLSAEATASAQGVLFECFLPAMVQRHPVLRDPTVESPMADVEGSVSFEADQTVFDLTLHTIEPAVPGSLVLENDELLNIPKGIPEDAINFFNIKANLGEVMMDVIEKNREDRSFAERAYTRFYTKHHYFPIEKLSDLMGSNAYRFQLPGRRRGTSLGTVWVWASENGPEMANSLAAILTAENSGSLNITVKRNGELTLFEIPLEGEKWYMLGMGKRVFFTNEVEALMARSQVKPLIETMQIPDEMFRDQAMVFYRNQKRLPKVLNRRPLDLSSFPALWWYVAQVYPYQFGRIHKTEEGDYEAQTWLRF